MTPILPQRLVDFATGEFGDRGHAWLDELPDILRRCQGKWRLTLGPPVEEIKVNYVGYARLPSGAEAVLKVGVPHPDFSTEMEALATYEGRGINRLLDRDEGLNAMLLERLHPGTMLAAHDDEQEQMQAAAEILRRLHETPAPSGHRLPHFCDWIDDALGDARACSDPERARPFLEQFPRVLAMMDRLRRPEEPQRLLHGDLHHFNILLDDSRGWMAIDPKGVIGAACLDAGRFINNAFEDGAPRPRQEGIARAAARVLGEALGQSEERMLAAAYCDRVMGSSWGLDHPPDDGEAHGREILALLTELVTDIDVERL